jgi:ATP-dependent DNA helicase PIF1
MADTPVTKVVTPPVEDQTDTYVQTIFNLWKEQNIFVTGPGGTGKSYLMARVIKAMKEGGFDVRLCASSGIAAYEIGQKIAEVLQDDDFRVTTFNSFGKVGLGIKVDELSEEEAAEEKRKLFLKIRGQASKNPGWFEHIKGCDYLGIEEVSMISSHLLDLVSEVCQMIRGNAAPFGGIKVCFIGDFLQLPPVTRGKDTPKPWAFSSSVWERLAPTPILLSEPKRYPDVAWFKLLKRIRKGEASVKDIKFLKEIQQMGIPEFAEGTVRPTYLFSHRATVDAGNLEELRKLTVKNKKYLAEDSYLDRRGRAMPEVDKIKEKQLEDIAPASVSVKVGAQVMLCRNLDVSRNLVNGRRGIVTETRDDLVMVTFEGDVAPTPIEPYEYKVQDDFGTGVRLQIPLILAWYMTIHKSQGVTLTSAVISLGNDIFEDGQAYVALSRVRTSEGLFITDFSKSSLRANQQAVEFYEQC